jgi:hypothetical protein
MIAGPILVGNASNAPQPHLTNTAAMQLTLPSETQDCIPIPSVHLLLKSPSQLQLQWHENPMASKQIKYRLLALSRETTTPRRRQSKAMDPFSIVLGGITICQVAQKIISLGIAYGQSVTSLPTEVQALVSEIALLSGVFDSLCSHLKVEDGAERPISADLLDGPIEECKQQLEELHEFLVKHQSGGSRIRKLGRALKWPMKEQETRDWIVRMERYKNTFSLALQQEEL